MISDLFAECLTFVLYYMKEEEEEKRPFFPQPLNLCKQPDRDLMQLTNTLKFVFLSHRKAKSLMVELVEQKTNKSRHGMPNQELDR